MLDFDNENQNVTPSVDDKPNNEYDYNKKYQDTYAKYNFGADHVNDKYNEYHTNKSYADISNNEEQRWSGTRSGGWTSFFRSFPYPLICVIIYLIVGFACNAWHPAWVIFLTIPTYYSLVEGFATYGKIRFPIFTIVLFTYLLMGFLGNLWHPGWVVFLAWPLYFVFGNIMKIKNTHLIVFTLLCIGIYLILGFTIHLWHPSWIVFLTIPLFESLYISTEKLVKEKKVENVGKRIEKAEKKLEKAERKLEKAERKVNEAKADTNENVASNVDVVAEPIVEQYVEAKVEENTTQDNQEVAAEPVVENSENKAEVKEEPSDDK